MRSLKAVCCVSWLVFAGALAVACGDDNGGSGGEGGDGNSAGAGLGDGGTTGSGASSSTGGKAGGGGKAGSGGTAGSSEGGEPSLGGTTGEGGEPGNPGGTSNGEGGEGGSGGDPVDPVLCENFPVTVTAGPTIQIGVTGALICLDPCRVTTNTYSGESDSCPFQTPFIGFWVTDGDDPFYDVYLPDGWNWESASSGDIMNGQLRDVPEATEVTAVVTDAAENEHTLVFTFPGNGQVTITSFTAN